MQKIRYSYDQNNKMNSIESIFLHLESLGYYILTHDLDCGELIVEVIECERKDK